MKKSILISLMFFCLYIRVFSAGKPYVLLVSFDAFRYDYLDRGLTPNLNKFADQGIRALSLRPAFPSKTFPNHQSIINGMFPENHGIISNSIYDPYKGSLYRISDSVESRNPKWYQGEAFWETAERQGITSASCFWPGSELSPKYRRPSYSLHYDRRMPYKERVKQVMDWLKLPYEKRPHFITLYFESVDDMGHGYGPCSEEVNSAIKGLDSISKEIFNGVQSLGLKDSLNIIIVSDHGMIETPQDKAINAEENIRDFKCRFEGTGPVMMVWPEKEKISEVYLRLKSGAKNYRTYLKDSIPSFYRYSKNSLIAPIILIAEPGYSLLTDREWKNPGRYMTAGNHGFEKDVLEMHGIFIAGGPGFKKHYKTGTLWNIDIYPLLCKLLNVEPRENIDGSYERIGFILNE